MTDRTPDSAAPDGPASSPTRSSARRRFGPVLLVGLTGGGLAAVAGNRGWAAVADGAGSGAGGIAETAVASGASEGAPLVTALGLVVLACWGVLLVSRGPFRRAVSALAGLAAAGVLAAAVTAWLGAPDRLAEALAAYGATDLATGRTAWASLGVVAGLLALGSAVVALRDVRDWPEMGSRYDAPASAAAGSGSAQAARRAEPETSTNLDLWRAIDEGEDPTR